MPKNILMPSLAAGMETGTLVRWLKQPGDAITKGDALAEIETDKAVLELEADDSGVLGAILIEDGAAGVPVNSAIAVLLKDGETAESVGPTASDLPPATVAQAAASPPKPAPLPAPVRPDEKPSPVAVPTVANAAGNTDAAMPKALRRPAASPLARRVAGLHDIDLSGLKGSGPHGRIVRIDVERARSQQGSASATATLAAGAALHSSWLRQGSGTPLVLIHGFGADLNGWRPLLAGAPVNRPVLAIDLPGHGGSAALDAPSFDGLVAAVSTGLRALDLDRFDLVGHSLGGAVSAALAAEAQLDIATLMLISPAGLGPEINGAFIDGLARAEREESLEPWLKELVADRRLITPAFVKASLQQRRQRGMAGIEALARSVFPDGTQAFSIRDALTRIACPTAVVFGLEDRIIPSHQTRGLPGLIGLHLFAGVGHMPHLERRDDLWRLLERHLRTAG